LGSKSGYAYGNQFSITSYHGGIKSVYTAIKDDSRKGKLLLIDESPSKETGIEISIPVRTDDISSFHRKVAFILSFFDQAPQVLRSASKPSVQPHIWEGKNWFVPHETFWGKEAAQPYVVMGDVCYPLQKERLHNITPQQTAPFGV
jgi:hypothetical protein